MTHLALRRALLLLALISLVACAGDATPTPSSPNSSLSVSSLDFGRDTSTGNVVISNTGNASSSWNAVDFVANSTNPAALPASFTIRVNPASGIIPAGGSDLINLSIDRNDLSTVASGTYQLELRFRVDGVQKSLKLSFTVVNAPSQSGDYKIQIEFSGPDFTPSRRAVFETAAAIWAEAITKDLVDIDIPSDSTAFPANLCGFSHRAVTGTIDDLLIFANVQFIDGPNNILARAGPIFPGRGADGQGLPFLGCMQFDSADVAALEAAGALQNTIVHEMGHVLGIGTQWDTFSTGSCAEGGTGTPTFTGSNAVAEWTTLNGGTPSGNVPIEDDGGEGTRCGHWDEETFFTELMTGFLNTAADPLSRLTIGSLADIGYETDPSKAEPYSLPACSPNCSELRLAGQSAGWESIQIYSAPQSIQE